MPATIRPLNPADVQTVVAFSLRAWEPVFRSFATVLGPSIYERIYPDWRVSQAAAVEHVCTDAALRSWVADVDGRAVGFVAVVVHGEEHSEPGSGEIDMIAVDPDHQRQGIAGALIDVAVDHLRASGVRLAVIATGGDPGHAPARRAYERAGFTGLPLVRYYRALDGA